MVRIDACDEPVLYPYRDADPYFAHLHLLGARRRLKWIEQDDRKANETLSLALEADAAAAESCLALDHDRQVVLLTEPQRQALEDCVYALNRLVLEVQCELTRVQPLGPASVHHLVAYMLFWRNYQPICFKILKLPKTLRVFTKHVRLKHWLPAFKSQRDLELRYGELLAQPLH